MAHGSPEPSDLSTHASHDAPFMTIPTAQLDSYGWHVVWCILSTAVMLDQAAVVGRDVTDMRRELKCRWDPCAGP